MDRALQKLNDYLTALGVGGKIDVGDTALQALKDTIDDETEKFKRAVLDNVPGGADGGLGRSFIVEKIESKDYYGYEARFDGETKYGDSWEKVANVQNHGTDSAGVGHNIRIPGSHFVDKAVHGLKGLDARAARLAEYRLLKKNKEGK